MCLAEDNNIKIYYQDTDSMHIENDKIDMLTKLFREKYNRELVGINMGQFHCDFEMYNGKKPLHTVKTIILGKKVYFDKIKYEDNSYHTHFRMKGIPSNIVEHKAKKRDGNVEQLYEYLYKGRPVEFNLLALNKKFKIGIDGNITNWNKFSRKICFIKNQDILINDDGIKDLEKLFDEIEEI